MWVQGDVLSHLISHRDRLLEEFLDAPRRHGVLLHHASIGWCIRCHGSDDQGQGLRRSCPLASTKLMPGSSSESGSREATAYSYWIAVAAIHRSLSDFREPRAKHVACNVAQTSTVARSIPI